MVKRSATSALLVRKTQMANEQDKEILQLTAIVNLDHICTENLNMSGYTSIKKHKEFFNNNTANSCCNSRFAVVRFCNHAFDFRPNCTPLNAITALLIGVPFKVYAYYKSILFVDF